MTAPNLKARVLGLIRNIESCTLKELVAAFPEARPHSLRAAVMRLYDDREITRFGRASYRAAAKIGAPFGNSNRKDGMVSRMTTEPERQPAKSSSYESSIKPLTKAQLMGSRA